MTGPDQMNEPNAPEAVDLRSYLQPIWRRKWIVLLVTAIAAAGTYLVSSSKAETYAAATQVYIESANPTQGIGTGQVVGPPTSQQLEDIAKLFTAQSITTRVYKSLQMPIGSAGSVQVSPQEGSSFISVAAESRSPALAARLANTYASTFLRARASQVENRAKSARIAAQAALATLPSDSEDPNASAQRQTLLAQIAQLQSIELNRSAGARQIERAEAPTAPSSPRPVRDAIFAAVIGLVLGILTAFALALLDNRLISVSMIETIFKRPILAVLAHVDDPAPTADGHPSTPTAFVEAMRTLRVNLRLVNRERPARTMLITSSLPREGKTTVVRALALAYAEAGERVLVIDADLRRPSVAATFGVEAEAGLTQVLRAEKPLSEATVTAPAPAPALGDASTNDAGSREADPGDLPARASIDVLAHGEQVQDPVTLLSSETMSTLLHAASESYDTVILDTPPLLPVSDAVPLLELVDAALLIVRLGEATRGSADRLSEIVERIPGVNLAGIVVNDVRSAFGRDGYGAYGYYGYGYPPAEVKSKVDA